MTDIGKLETDAYFEKIDTMMGNLSRLIKQSNHKDRTYYPIIIKVDHQEKVTQASLIWTMSSRRLHTIMV